MRNLKTFEKYTGPHATVGFRYSQPKQEEELKIYLSFLQISPMSLIELSESIIEELNLNGSVIFDEDKGILTFKIKTYSELEAKSIFKNIIENLEQIDNDIKAKFEKRPWGVNDIESGLNVDFKSKSQIGFKY